MFKDALVIFKKELRNLFKDRRTLFSTFLLPMVIMPIIFIGMGVVLKTIEDEAHKTTYKIAIEGNNDQLFREILATNINFVETQVNESDFILFFGPNYNVGTKAEVVLSYDSSSRKNQWAASMIQNSVASYDLELADKLLRLYGLSYQQIHTLSLVVDDTATEAVRSGGSLLATLVPYFMVIFLFSGSMNAGLDTTSGEKERGFLAVLLVNQVSRSSIAWGKIFYVSIVAIISATATFIGLLISMLLPIGSQALFSEGLIKLTIAFDALLIIISALLSCALLSASLVTLLGSLAKTVKEGSSYVMPLYMGVVLVGVTTMYMDPTKNLFLFLIPIVNTIFVLKESFMGMYLISHAFVTLLSNLAFAIAISACVARLFNSERILQTT
jgi:sodium transport system permease protein